ncbi:MAG: PilX N-terminal domain-containing pilus assembly protein [Candidatus Sulfotelmatobacter sp.]
MGNSTRDSRGFTLIAALLMTLLLSALAVGLLYLVNNEQRMGNNDLEGNLAYYGAEAGIENLTAQLSTLYQTSQTPDSTSINALTNAANYPTAVTGSNITNMNYVETITWPATQTNGTPCPNAPNPCGAWDIVGSGSDQGMVASLIPFTLQVTATRAASAGEVTNNVGISPTGASVNLTRTLEVAELPAFEFGIFCDGDCDYFAGPNFNFGGRVHANGNLFLASGGSNLTFTDKVAAVGQVILDQLENGWPTSNQYGGKIWIPNASNGCPAAPTPGPGTTPATCTQLSTGSWTGGFPPTGTANTTTWRGISTTTFNGFVVNGLTGATKLQLPFVQSSKVGAIDIIRRPTATDSTLLSNSRLYNKAAIRILLADTEADLYPGSTRSDSSTQDIQLGTPNSNPYTSVSTVATGNGVSAGNMYYAVAQANVGNWSTLAPAPCSSSPATWPLFGQVTVAGKQCQGAWLRVEYYNTTSASWVGVTTQWLGYGLGRGYNAPPTHPYSTSTASVPYCQNYPTYPAGQCQNGISPAILILQQLQSGKSPSAATGAATTANNWIPINFYDSREGEPRDVRPSTDTGVNCSPNGIMNAVELDVGNLWLWLQGSGPYSTGSGKSVSITDQNGTNENGYILYFSDHRGMIPDAYPFPGITFYNGFTGMSGLNDTVNSTSTVGVPNNTLEPITYYATATPTPYSPEDTAVKGTGVLGTNVDNWGEKYLGAGFGISTANMALPYYIAGSVTANAIQCYSSSAGPSTAEWNMVTGPRHVLRLVDGGMDSSGNSFVPPTGGSLTTNGNGFTIASEEPVYVWGNYNTGPADPFWPSENTTTTPHSAAAIIADAVTLLSNPPSNATLPTAKVGWYDQESFLYPQQAVAIPSTGPPYTNPGRQGNTSYYRMAIAAGKSIPFPEPSWASTLGWKDFGTDGGMHNFLRYLEDRSDNGNGATVNYAGSMISMYYSQYATGIFKCCNSTYNAPVRNYFFDTQFLNPANLPPGTPMFQDVVSLSYHQSFTPQ